MKGSKTQGGFGYPEQVPSEGPIIQTLKRLTCNTCQNDFSDKNELMHHKKREHPSNIICKHFLDGNCRRSANNGAMCWYRHDQLPMTAPNVNRSNLIIPAPGTTSWNMNFPQLPTSSQGSVVGLQQQMMLIWQQQKQEQHNQQAQHQQHMAAMMSQLMNLNM